MLVVYSDVASGEAVRFVHYDYETGTQTPLRGGVSFKEDMILGDGVHPVVMEAESKGSMTVIQEVNLDN